MGLTSILVGCSDMQSDADSDVAGGGTSNESYLELTNGLNGVNGMNAANGLNAVNGLSAANGLSSANGLGSANGYKSTNGLSGANGFNTANGLNAVNGLNTANGLNSVNGLSSANGLMTTSDGRMTVSYMVRCALASGDTLVKQDQNGVNYTFQGGIGLAPGWKSGSCGRDCTEMMSACLMAHINSVGVHIPLWMTSPMSSIGWGQSPWYPNREGTFFGQIVLTNPENNIDGYFCNGPGFDSNTVPGRLGSNQGSVPYANAYPTSGGDCNSHCSMQANGDGAVSCPANGTTWTHPITVWRGQTFQAEDAVFDAGQSAAPQSCSPAKNCGGGKRVSWIRAGNGLTLKNVNVAIAGTNNLVVYYTNGDLASQPKRTLSISVNGGPAQYRDFVGTGASWDTVTNTTISLAGFKAGSSNTIYFMGANGNQAPDLDWVEVLNNTSTGSAANYCDSTKWVESSSKNNADAGKLNDGNYGSRWSSSSNQASGDWVRLDFGGTVKLTSLTLDNTGTSGADYASAVELFASTDGTNFESSPFATGTGGTTTTVTFAQKSMKSVKVRLKTPNSNGNWWSIGEIDASCSM